MLGSSYISLHVLQTSTIVTRDQCVGGPPTALTKQLHSSFTPLTNNREISVTQQHIVT